MIYKVKVKNPDSSYYIAQLNTYLTQSIIVKVQMDDNIAKGIHHGILEIIEEPKLDTSESENPKNVKEKVKS